MVTVSIISGYRTRLTGLLGQTPITDEVLNLICSRIVNQLASEVHHTGTQMANWFAEYKHDLGLSDRDSKTVTRYLEVVNKFADWLKDRPVTAENAKEFLSFLRNGGGYAQSSIRLYYHVLKQFLAFANINLKLKIRKPKVIHRYHDRADIERIFVQAERGLYHHSPAKRKRNKALVLAYTGMRRSELLALMVCDVDFNRRTIMVKQGKNQKDRSIPMADRIVVPLREQCADKSESDKVFDCLNEHSVYRIVTSLAKACGINGFHPHSFRHYFATQLVERGANLRAVQVHFHQLSGWRW